MREVHVRIDNEGKSHFDLQGFHGQGCGDLVDKLKQGRKVLSEETKPEFYENNTNEQLVTT